MSVGNYLNINKVWIINFALLIIITNLIVFGSVHLKESLADIIYMDFIMVLIQLSTVLYGYKKQKKKFEAVIKYAAGEDNIRKLSAYEEDFHIKTLLKVLEKQNKEFYKREEAYRERINDLQEYITLWAHDIKVDIAVCDLLLEEVEIESESINKLCCQIEQIKFRINQVLHITRANHYNQDFTAEEFNVSREIKEAVKDNALFFINKNIKVETKIDEFTLVSDKKWFHYIISQILNNSSKYTQENGEVCIVTKEDERAYYIHIRDNGIGIPREDISRIFDKGFTGFNGRNSKKSTGMGLYYAKSMAEKLNIGIEVRSEKNKYTEFIIILFKFSDYYNITKISH